MLKTLLIKQFRSLFAAFGMRSKKAGAKPMSRGKKIAAGIGIGLLMLYCLVVFVAMFFLVGFSLAPILIELGLTWLYFTYMAISATVLGIFGSIFMTQAMLYDAKDNELLLSLPIPPRYILLCRMIPLYVETLAFEAIVLLPMMVAFAICNGGLGAALVVSFVLFLVLLPLLGLTICCILGWLIAILTSRMRNKSVFTVLLSLGFILAYFAFYPRIGEYMTYILENSIAIGEAFDGIWLLSLIGRAGSGEFLPLLLTVLLIGAFFALVYALLSASYIRIVTTKRGAKKLVYREKKRARASLHGALLAKETRRFLASPTYLLNAGLGTVLLVIGTGVVAVKGVSLFGVSGEMPPVLAELLPYLACLFSVMVASMNCVSAPSLALEGKNFWILRTLPVEAWQVMRAKLTLHFLVTGPAAFVCTIVLSLVFGGDILVSLMLGMIAMLFVVFHGCMGLIFGANKPNMNWDNEAMVVKQSLSVLFSMLLGFGVALLMGGGCVLLCGVLAGGILPFALYAFVWLILLAIVDILLVLSLQKNSEKMLSKL